MVKIIIVVLVLLVFDILSGFPVGGMYGLLFSLIALLTSSAPRYAYRRKGAGIYLILFILELIVAGYFSGLQIKEKMRAGNEVAQALERYKTEKGAYPETLNELAYKYLSQSPDKFSQIRYMREKKCGANMKCKDNDQSYFMFFHAYGFTHCSYNSLRKNWFCTD